MQRDRLVDPFADVPPPGDHDYRRGRVEVVTVLDLSWQPIPLGPVLSGVRSQPEPEILRRDDYQDLLYRNSVNGLHGDSGTGKGWVVCVAILEQLRAGRFACYIDLEDNESSIVARLRILGATDDEIDRLLLYVRPSVPFDQTAVEYLCKLIDERSVSLIVIDSVGEAFALEGLDENKDSEVGPWIRRVARPLAETGAAVLLVDHSTKAGDNTLHPSGSKRKRAAITGASYLVEAVDPLVKGSGGRLRITCAKDRHGTYRRGEVAGELVLTPTATDGLRAVIYAPKAKEVDGSVAVILAARSACTAAKSEGKPMSLRSLIAAMSIKASRDVKIGGVDLAVGRAALSETSGPNRSRLFTYITDLPEAS